MKIEITPLDVSQTLGISMAEAIDWHTKHGKSLVDRVDDKLGELMEHFEWDSDEWAKSERNHKREEYAMGAE